MPACFPRATCATLMMLGCGSSSDPGSSKPNDLASYFHWHGDVFTDGQIIDTIYSTRPTRHRRQEQGPQGQSRTRLEPEHPHEVVAGGVGVLNLNLQGAKVRAVVAGDMPARTPQFVTMRNGAQERDAASLQRACAAS